MNKKEMLALGVFLVCVFLVGFILFSGLNTDVKIVVLESGRSIKADIPPNFSLVTTVVLMVLSFLCSGAFFYFVTDLSKKVSLSRKQRLSVDMLEGDEKKLYIFILEKPGCLQKDLVYELKMPKVKVTRILDKLTSKRLVKRVSYGKTNKIVPELY